MSDTLSSRTAKFLTNYFARTFRTKVIRCPLLPANAEMCRRANTYGNVLIRLPEIESQVGSAEGAKAALASGANPTKRLIVDDFASAEAFVGRAEGPGFAPAKEGRTAGRCVTTPR